MSSSVLVFSYFIFFNAKSGTKKIIAMGRVMIYIIYYMYINVGFTISPCLSFFNVFFIFKKRNFSRLSYIVYCIGEDFSIFQFEFSVYFTYFPISNPVVGCCQFSPVSAFCLQL